jgi:hypothetical protein
VRFRVLSILLAAVAVAVTLTAGAAPTTIEAAATKKHPRKVPLSKNRSLWATINVCDTAAMPNTIGIRGSMPGLSRSATVLMRFQVQYLAKADGKWHNIVSGADSHWKSLGRLRGKVIESGQNFTFMPPTDGGAHHLRGSVRFKWVRRGHVIARQRKFTEAGHRSTAGADPAGYSAAFCDIT